MSAMRIASVPLATTSAIAVTICSSRSVSRLKFTLPPDVAADRVALVPVLLGVVDLIPLVVGREAGDPGVQALDARECEEGCEQTDALVQVRHLIVREDR